MEGVVDDGRGEKLVMSCEATVRQHPSHFIGNSVNAMFRSNKQTRRRILRGRKVLGIEQIEAEIGVSSESSSMSELNSESSRCKVDDRRQMMHELAVIRERQRLERMELPNFNIATDRAPPINLTVSTLEEEMSSSIRNQDECDENTENIDPLLEESEPVDDTLYNSITREAEQQENTVSSHPTESYKVMDDVLAASGDGHNQKQTQQQKRSTIYGISQELLIADETIRNDADDQGDRRRSTLIDTAVDELRRKSLKSSAQEPQIAQVPLTQLPETRRVSQVVNSAAVSQPNSQQDEEEPMEIDQTLNESERTQRMRTAANAPPQANEQNEGKRGEWLTDLVLGVGTTKVPQPYGVARKWTNSVASRKSYACGQRIDNNDDETIVEDVGNSKTATVRSVRHSMDSAITRPTSDVYDNVGETYVMAETTTATTHEEEMAARALMGLSNASVATKMPTEIHQSPEKLPSSSSAQPDSVKNAVENEEISHSSSQTGNDTAGTQEVTVINKAVVDNSALEKSPKSRWDDETTLVENAADKTKTISENSLSLDVPHTGVPAVLKGTFNESSIEKITNEGDTHNESTLVATRSMREEMLNFLDASYGGHAKAPKSNRTLFSFKTPKKTNAGKSKVDIRRHSHHVTTATTAQKDAVFEKRVTSTPYSENQPHVCPRFAAHQARSLSPARTKQQKSAPSTPVSGSRMVRIGPGTRILHSPVVNVAKEDKSSPFRVPSIPSTTRRSQTTSVALQQIADYKSPDRSREFDTVNISSSTNTLLPSPRPSGTKHSRIPAPSAEEAPKQQQQRQRHSVKFNADVSDEVKQYLISGGTPRPNSRNESGTQAAARAVQATSPSSPCPRRSGFVLIEPKTPAAGFDFSQLLSEQLLASGPVCRRQPLQNRRSSRLPLPKLNFDTKPEDGLEQQSKPKTELGDANQSTDSTEKGEPIRKIVIGDEDDEDVGDYGMDGLESEASRLSIHDDDEVDDAIDRVKVWAKETVRATEQRKSIRTKLLDLSIATLNSPEVEKDSTYRLQKTIVDSQQDSLALSSTAADISACSSHYSPIHITAAPEPKHEEVGYLAKRKIEHPHDIPAGVRRSTRNRVPPLRSWLGEQPIYRIDENHTLELVDVSTVSIRDRYLLKYNTASPTVAFERAARTQKQRAHARKLLRESKLSRKKQKIKELKEKHKRAEDLDVSTQDIRTSSSESESD